MDSMKLIKKSTTPFSIGLKQYGKEFAVVLEPKPGYSSAQLQQAALAASASHLQWLSDKMLSAVITPDTVDRLSSVATITLKRLKSTR
jgi:hypothetical protein